MDHDFDESNINSYTEIDEESENEDFKGLPSPQKTDQEITLNLDKIGETTSKEDEDIEEEKKGLITIEIDSVDKLIGGLRFATFKLNEAYEKVSDSKLKDAINQLSKIENRDYDDFYNNLQNNINLEKVDEIINHKTQVFANKIEKKLNSNIKVIDQAAKKYEKYAETFEDEEVYNTFEKIDNLEKFMKNFKIKSIIIASFVTAIVTATISFLAMNQLYQYKINSFSNEQKIKNEKASLFFNKIDNQIQILENKNSLQIHIKDERVNLYLMPDNTKVMEIKK